MSEGSREGTAPRRGRRILKRLAVVGAGLVVLGFLGLCVAYFMSDNDCGSPAVAAVRNPMQAIRYCGYGSPEVLGLTLLEKPVPTDEQLLIKVHAASVNPLDWHYMRGTPYLMRLGAGLRKPKITRLGVDFSGTVEAVGAKVTKFKPGDEVFGARFGAFAEYIVARQDGAVTLKPANITFEQAASVPIAAITALQSLRDRGRLQPGQKVLINGASGGVGTFAVQIAKSYGAEVTGVCSGRNVEMVKSLGADHVVDYTKEDFAKTDERYDLILDNVPNHTLAECRHIMKEKGIYLQIGGGGPHDGNWIGPFGRVINAWVVSHFISQDMAMFLADMNQDDLAVLAELMAAGKVTPVIDRTYTLRETSAAIAYLEEGHARGKVVITMQ